MAIVNSPPTTAVDGIRQERDKSVSLQPPNPEWRNFFQQLFTVGSALTMSGTTAQRPTTARWAGRTYFDTTLGMPIWWDAAAAVWVDATGAPA